MKNLIALGIFALAAVLGVMAWVIYSSTKKAQEAVAVNVDRSLEGTQNLNTLAGQISRVLSSFGVK